MSIVKKGILVIVLGLIFVALNCMFVFAESVDSSKDIESKIEITKVDYVYTYSMPTTTVTAEPDKVIIVVQTNQKWENHAWVSVALDNYVFQYTTADSKTGSAHAVAVGNQDKLADGSMLQVWRYSEGLSDGVVGPSQYITGLTVMAALPKDVISFTINIKNISFVSQPIKCDMGKDLPSTK